MAKLDHPRCLRAFACGRDAENVYIAYAYVPGRTFRECLRAREASTDADAIEVAAQVLDGLAHAHERGIVHRDVKPANVLLADDEDGISVRILDFGLARFADGETLTAAGDVPGTLAYIAPERLHGEPAGAGGRRVVGRRAALRGARRPSSVLALVARRDRRGDRARAAAASHRAARPARRAARGRRPRARPRPGEATVGGEARARCCAARAATATARRSRAPQQVERQVVAPALAGVYAGAGASLLPFFPAHAAPRARASLAAALTFFAPRWGARASRSRCPSSRSATSRSRSRSSTQRSRSLWFVL